MTPKQTAIINTTKIILTLTAVSLAVSLALNYIPPQFLGLGLLAIAMCGAIKLIYNYELEKANIQARNDSR